MRLFNTLKNKLVASEFSRIIKVAGKFPRFQEKSILFRGYKLNMPDYLSVAYQLDEFFGQEKMKFGTDNSVPVIYDCGANVGIATIYFKYLFPSARVVSFEPDPLIFAYLKRNILAAKLDNLELINAAVWSEEGELDFGSEGADGGSVFHSGNKVSVKAKRLSLFLSREKHIDLLKIDIEGAEGVVLKECESQLHKVERIFIEYHSWTSKVQELDEILTILKRNNFRYTIPFTSKKSNHPFINSDEKPDMDIQLDIYAVRSEK